MLSNTMRRDAVDRIGRAPLNGERCDRSNQRHEVTHSKELFIRSICRTESVESGVCPEWYQRQFTPSKDKALPVQLESSGRPNP